jgi:type II secretory pathway component PulF
MAAESQGGRAERPLYTSPQRKLGVFFAQSRDQWKEKCRSAKARLKQLKKQVQRGAARQRRHHERLQALASEVVQLQAENRRLAEALAARGKKEWGAE